MSVYTSDRPDDAESFTVIGVLPADFWFIHTYTAILTNLRTARRPYLFKLREGVSSQQLETHLNGVVRAQIENIDPEWPGMSVVPTQDIHVRTVRPVLRVLFTAAGFVLLIVCANVAMLLTVRAMGRERELSVRRALGASRLRIARELCLEGLMLALIAGGLGILVATVALSTLGPLIETQLRTRVPGGAEALQVGGQAILITLLLSGLTSIIFAVAPALAATSRSVARCLVESGTSSSDTPRQKLLRNAVIGGEIAIALVLLIGTALMLQSALYLQRLNLGFDPDKVLTANLSLRRQDYSEAHKLTRFVDHFLSEVRSTPGVIAVTMTAGWPFQDRQGGAVLLPGMPQGSAPTAVTYVVADDYFRTLSIPMLRGREFGKLDLTDSEQVVILSEELARQLWPEQDPVGRRVRLGAEGADAPERTVVGISKNVHETLTGENLPDSYLPFTQSPSRFLFVMARIGVEPAAVVATLEQTMLDLDPMGAVSGVQMMATLISRQRKRPQFLATLLGCFTAFATLLALVGLYAIVSYAVSQRRQDIAIRMALGATGQSVVNLFLRRALTVVSGGVAAGMLVSLGLTQYLASQLYGITSLDAMTYFGTTLLLLAAALVAVWLPARSASATDPILVLRDQRGRSRFLNRSWGQEPTGHGM